MQTPLALVLLSSVIFSVPQNVVAQAFGEYGRAVGSLPGGPAAPRGPQSGGAKGGIDRGSFGDLGGKALPARLIVVSREAGLFPRQDAETAKIAQLLEGEKLVPLVQSEGNDPWYMVKTEKGVVGWVKSTDVKRELEVKR